MNQHNAMSVGMVFALVIITISSKPSAFAKTESSQTLQPIQLTLDLPCLNVPNGTGRISGRVISADTSQPLAGVEVSALEGGIELCRTALTDVTGVYTITNLGNTSSIYMCFDASNDAVATPYALGCLSSPVTATNGQTLSNINFQLRQGVQITGSVTALGSSAPISNVLISVYNAQQANKASPYGGAVARPMRTSATGAFVTPGLLPGNYKVEFLPLPETPFGKPDFLSEYFNDKATLANADVVEVTASSGILPNINASLAPGGRIEAIVLTADTSSPIPVTMVTVAGNSYEAPWFANTDSTGKALFKPLRPGSYTVRASPTTSDTTRYLSDSRELTVTDGLTTTVTFVLQRGGLIKGRLVEAQTQQPLPRGTVRIIREGETREAEFLISDSGGYFTGTVGLATGIYTVTAAYPTVFAPVVGEYPFALFGYIGDLNVTAPLEINVVISMSASHLFLPFAPSKPY
jgi:hypothetical protein